MPNVCVKAVISDKEDAPGLQTAKTMDVPAVYIDPGPFKTKMDEPAEQRYIDFLKEKKVDLICLAGFMRIIKDKLIAAFPGRILNIHPSLLPKFPGLNVQAKAISAGEKKSGCTVHFVDTGIDTGSIIRQRKVPILDGDTAEILAARILTEEHILYSNVLRDISENKIKLS